MIITGRDNVVKKVSFHYLPLQMMFWTCALSVVNARMRHGMIAQLQFPILVFLFLVKDGIALPVSILTMIGIAWVSLAIKILIAALAI